MVEILTNMYFNLKIYPVDVKTLNYVYKKLDNDEYDIKIIDVDNFDKRSSIKMYAKIMVQLLLFVFTDLKICKTSEGEIKQCLKIFYDTLNFNGINITDKHQIGEIISYKDGGDDHFNSYTGHFKENGGVGDIIEMFHNNKSYGKVKKKLFKIKKN